MKFLFFLNCIEICFGGKKFGGRSGGGGWFEWVGGGVLVIL